MQLTSNRVATFRAWETDLLFFAGERARSKGACAASVERLLAAELVVRGADRRRSQPDARRRDHRKLGKLDRVQNAGHT